jgi:hypothetical protein
MIVEKHSRLPRKYSPEDNEPAEKQTLDQANLPALCKANPQEILLRYLSDESTKDIAASYGVTRQALGKHLLKHAEADWKEAQVARAIARKEKAEDDLENAKDPLALAKARELFKAATWDLERVCRRIYGEERNSETPITPILNITIATEKSGEAPRHVSVSLARVSDVQAPQYDSEAPQHDTIIDVHPVDNSDK